MESFSQTVWQPARIGIPLLIRIVSSTKSGQPISVPLNRHALAAIDDLLDYRRKHNITSPYLFARDEGEHAGEFIVWLLRLDSNQQPSG